MRENISIGKVGRVYFNTKLASKCWGPQDWFIVETVLWFSKGIVLLRSPVPGSFASEVMEGSSDLTETLNESLVVVAETKEGL